MKKKLLLVLCIAVMLVTIGVVYAAISAQYTMPQTGNPPVPTASPTPVPTASPTPSPTPAPVISASFQVDGQPWTNGTAISWGQLVAGANTKSIVVTNTGTVAIASITISSEGLPAGWTETLVMGALSGGSIPGTITLNADATVSGTQSWTSTITLNSP